MLTIRFHGRGGQGIKTASRILGTALFLENFEVQDAPRYGAERRGAPMSAYVRAARGPILERGVIRHPGLIVVADDTLIPIASAGVLAGIQHHTVLLIRSRQLEASWRERLNLNNPTLILPAAEASLEPAELHYLGTLCAAAAASLLGVIGPAQLAQAIRAELESLPAEIIEANVRKAQEAYDYFKGQSGCVSETPEVSARNYEKPNWIDMPFDEASISAPVIHGGLSSVEVKTGLWRTMRPVIDHQLCHRCVWVCGSFCPDSAISLTAEGYPQVDYDHCKGCMICLAQCPSHAIRAIPEAQADEQEKSR